MDFRALQSIRSLQQALPILLRHLSAYLELAGQDLVAIKDEITARMKALVLVAASGLLSVLMICVFVIALTWDSEARLPAIGILCGVFIAATVAAMLYLNKRSIASTFPSVRREWQQDKEIVYQLLADNREAKTDSVV